MQTTPATKVESLPLGQRQRLLLRLLRLRSGRQLRRMLARLHPADIAPLFPLLKPDEQVSLLEVLFEMRVAGHTLRELDSDTLRQVVEGLPDDRLAVILARLPADDAVDLLDELDKNRRETLLSNLDRALAARLNNLMLYGESTAGGIMDPDVIFFSGEQEVSHTLEVLRQLAENRRLFYLYVTDERGHLVGLVKLWQLLTAHGDQKVSQVMTREVISVRVDTPQEEVARLFSRYDLPLMPVVDEDGRLVGVITVDDVIDVIEEEASLDLYRLGGLMQPETLGAPVLRSFRNRLPLLLVSLVAAILAALVIAAFQATLAKYVLLAALMHVVGSTGGYAAKQTLTVLVAGLATGEMDLRAVWKVIRRQIAIGLLGGLATGALLAVVAWIWEKNWILAAVIFTAQAANVVISSTVGALVPLLLRRLRLDPTLGSSAAVVACADIAGFGCFLGLASYLIDKLL